MNKTKELLILVCNDDGYQAPGLKALIETVLPYGKVVAVVPEKGESGKSHSITITMPLRLNLVEEYDNFCMYTCSGTPVDSLKLALNKVLTRKPDIVVSGINHGSNSSVSVIYSGTMGAVIEACLNGIPAIGFSLLDFRKEADFTASKIVVKRMIENVIKQSLPPWVCLNVNIPRVKPEELKGIKLTRQAKGVWKEEFDMRFDPNNKAYYWMTGDFQNFEPDAKDTDEWALNNGYASVVPIYVDLTAHHVFNELSSWNYEL